MRITNQMSTNKMLLSISRNARRVDTLYSQISTGKKIQYPSDNPIIASRALKFRTNISDTEQYKRNADQASSWLGISEEGFSNMLSIMQSLRERLVQGSTDTLTADDRDKIVEEMRSFVEQIGAEMNITYAGRYVFSGFRTNEPPVITKDNLNAQFEITQEFSPADVQEIKTFVVDSNGDLNTYDIFKIDFPYKSTVDRPVNIGGSINFYKKDASGNFVTSTTDLPITITVPTGLDYDNRYNPGDYDAYYIPETGELILGKNAAEQLRGSGADKITVDYELDGLKEGELNPVVYFTCQDVTDPASIKYYNMDDQKLKFEFGTNTRIQINNLAKDSFTAALYSEMTNFVDMVESVNIPSDAETEEIKKYTDYLQQSFSNMLGRFEEHNANVLREYTTLGSRTSRIELTINRLEQNRVSYTTLMSENENVDYLEAVMNLNAMEAVYNASMMAGMKISQITLADYLR